MTLLWCDGFDHYGTDTTNMTDGAWAEVGSSGFSLNTDNPRTGSHALRYTDSSASKTNTRRVLGGAKVTVGLGAVFWYSNLPNVNDKSMIFEFRDAANASQVSIVLQSTGVIEVKRGSTETGTTLGDSVTPAITAEAYTHMEVITTIDDSAGAVEVRVNGVTVVSLTGVDTKNTSNTESSQVTVGTVSGTSSLTGVTTMYIDDLFCYDTDGSFNNTFLGDRKVLTLFPDADTAQADWSWNAGPSAFQAIDDTDPDDDATYIFANPGGSPAPVSEFDIDDLPVGVSAVSAVMLVNRMRKTDAGVANVQPSLVSASSETAGADRVLTEAYTYYHEVIEVDPDTAAPFTPAAVNAAKIKLERTA